MALAQQKLPLQTHFYFLRVLAAFFAEAERSAFVRLCAADLACRDSAAFDAALCGSRLRAFFLALERLLEGLVADLPLRNSRSACSRVFSGAAPSSGGGS